MPACQAGDRGFKSRRPRSLEIQPLLIPTGAGSSRFQHRAHHHPLPPPIRLTPASICLEEAPFLGRGDWPTSNWLTLVTYPALRSGASTAASATCSRRPGETAPDRLGRSSLNPSICGPAGRPRPVDAQKDVRGRANDPAEQGPARPRGSPTGDGCPIAWRSLSAAYDCWRRITRRPHLPATPAAPAVLSQWRSGDHPSSAGLGPGVWRCHRAPSRRAARPPPPGP